MPRKSDRMKWFITLSLAALCMAGCSGNNGSVITDVGNPPQDDEFEATIQLELRSSGGDEGAVAITHAWLSAERFRLIDAKTCSNDAPADRAEGFLFEMVPGELCEPVSFIKKRGDFCRLGLLLDPSPEVDIPDNAPAPVATSSLVIEGTRTSDNTPVMVVMDLGDKLKLDATDSHFTIDQEKARFVISFGMDSWWDTAQLAAAEVDSDGKILIDATHNTAILDNLTSALATQISLHLDDDGDGVLDDMERAATLATGGLVAP